MHKQAKHKQAQNAQNLQIQKKNLLHAPLLNNNNENHFDVIAKYRNIISAEKEKKSKCRIT